MDIIIVQKPAVAAFEQKRSKKYYISDGSILLYYEVEVSGAAGIVIEYKAYPSLFSFF